MSDTAVRQWQEKLEYLLSAQAMAVSAAEKFKLAKEIEEAYAQIHDLENHDPLIAPGLSLEQVLELIDVDGLRRLLRNEANDQDTVDLLIAHRVVNSTTKNQFDVTKLGALLFAKSLEAFDSIARKALRIVVYQGIDRTKGEAEHVQAAGYAVGFAEALDKINLLQPKEEILVDGQTQIVAVAPPVVLRELLINALMHQDLEVPGMSPMVEIFQDRLEITNPGRPLMEPDRFLDHPPISRNESLSALLRRVHLCEERGSGIEKALRAVENAQLPPPHFQNFDHATRVVLKTYRSFADLTVHERLRACYQHCVLRYVSGETMTNATLRERLGIAKKNHSMVSRLIGKAVDRQLIRAVDPEARSRSYVPAWVDPGLL